MTKKKKTRIERILDVLLTGSPLLLKDIAQRVSDVSGEAIKVQNIATLMAKLSSHRRCEVSHFMIKKKTSDGIVYNLVPEIQGLAPEEIYGLARQTGKDRFTLEMALQKIPELGKYVDTPLKATVRKKSVRKKSVQKKSASGKIKTRKSRPRKEAEAEIPDEPESQKTIFADLKESFREAVQRTGGLRIKFHFTAKVLKNAAGQELMGIHKR
jgi:hypothetical protein